jgi:uncharacterized protein GlcG (DUF336 family)
MIAAKVARMNNDPSLETAEKMIKLAQAEAKRRNIKAAAVVVDHAGHIIACSRADGAPYITVEIARRKATTAACFGVALPTLIEMVKADALIPAALQSVPDLLLLPGAVPVGSGALGISGGHYTEDQAIADACLDVQ